MTGPPTSTALDSFVTRISMTELAAARDVAASFAGQDGEAIFRDLIDGTGLDPDITADVLTAYTVLAWMVANRETAVPDSRAIAALRARLPRLELDAALGDPAVADGLRAELKLLFVTLHAGWQSARLDGSLARFSEGVHAMFLKQLGPDLRAIRLSDPHVAVLAASGTSPAR